MGDTGPLAACASALALPLQICRCPFCTLPARPDADAGLADAPLGVPPGVLGVPRGVFAADVPAACTAAVSGSAPSTHHFSQHPEDWCYMQSCLTSCRPPLRQLIRVTSSNSTLAGLKSRAAKLGLRLRWCCQLQSTAVSDQLPEHTAMRAATCSTQKPSCSGDIA